MDGAKQVACDAIERAKDDLFKVSQNIWSDPEEKFQEHHAHEALTAFLEKYGFNVKKNFHLPTAFRAVLGDGNTGPHVAVLCEYDALPEIGHACGHNLIAEVGVAAALGVKSAFQSVGKPVGKAEINWSTRPRLDVVNNMTVSDLYRTNAVSVGVDFEKYWMPDVSNASTASTDMGNVSYVVPSIHPIFYIGSTSVNHTRDFTTASGDCVAQPFTLAQGKALAMTSLDIFSNPAILEKVKDEFNKAVQPNAK